jgi:hypothetical protein
MCPHTTTYVSSYYQICVVLLAYVCRPASVYYVETCVCIHILVLQTQDSTHILETCVCIHILVLQTQDSTHARDLCLYTYTSTTDTGLHTYTRDLCLYTYTSTTDTGLHTGLNTYARDLSLPEEGGGQESDKPRGRSRSRLRHQRC